MKQLGWKWGAAAVFSLAPALSMAAVRTDFDTRANFGTYRTFAFRDADSGTVDSLVASRIRHNAAAQLQRFGMVEDNVNPDVILTYRVDVGTEWVQTVLPSGFGRWRAGYWGSLRRGYGFGGPRFGGFRRGFGYGRGGSGFDPLLDRPIGARVVETEWVDGSISMEMTDARTDQAVWRAMLKRTGGSVADVHSEKAIAKDMKDAFKKFPAKPVTGGRG